MTDTEETSISQELINAYHDGDGEAAAVLQMRGAALVPGLRLSDCATAAIVRWWCDTQVEDGTTEWESYVLGLHRDNRVHRQDANAASLAWRSHVQMED